MYQSFSRAIAACLLGATSLGAAAATELPYLDEVSVVALSLAEKRALTAEVAAFLKAADDGGRGRWSNQGGAVPVEVDFSADNSSASGVTTSATFCRELTLSVRAGGKAQQLQRKTCAPLSGKFDIEEQDPVVVAPPPFLSDVTLVKLGGKERASLAAAALTVLRLSEDNKPVPWSNKGLGGRVPLTATLTVSNTGGVGYTAVLCRDLSIVLETGAGSQTLLRRPCETRNVWDLDPAAGK
jgi:hypothetical protein